MFNNNEEMKELSAWVARDVDGRLYMNFSKPRKNTLSVKGWVGHDYIDVTNTYLDKQLEDLRFEDPPLKIVLRFDYHSSDTF